MSIPDHPEIAQALRTGHPHNTEPLGWKCLYCDRELADDENLYDYDGDLICDNCFTEQLLENMSAEDLAKRLGFRCNTVAAFAEELEY